MAENHFITRYCISKIDKNKKCIGGLETVKNLFSKTPFDFFYDKLFNKYFIEKEKIAEVALEEQSQNKKNFFKIIELEKNNNIIYGKIVFSDFDEVLNSLIAEKAGDKIASDMKFIPQRTFFFMLKFIKIREVAEKEMNVGILLLHKRGTHSIKSIFNDIITNAHSNVKLNLNGITFKDEFEELEQAEIKEVIIIKKDTMSDFSDEDISTLGIEKIKEKKIFKIKKGKKGINDYMDKFFKIFSNKEEAPFYFDITKDKLDVVVDSENGYKVVTYTSEEEGKQKISSIMLDNTKIYNGNDLNWDAIKKAFEEEMKECENKMKVGNWN